jgi:hypothetical protein
MGKSNVFTSVQEIGTALRKLRGSQSLAAHEPVECSHCRPYVRPVFAIVGAQQSSSDVMIGRINPSTAVKLAQMRSLTIRLVKPAAQP